MTIAGNYIGVAADGVTALANTAFNGFEGAGVRLYDGTHDNTIGGTVAAARNIISGNAGPGVLITDAFTTGNVVVGNYIGTDISGSAPLANNVGILVSAGANNNTIGGTTAAVRNIISGNQSYSINVTTNGNTIQNNYLGTDKTGLIAVPNASAVVIQNDGNAVIGNVISGNLGFGIEFYNSTLGHSTVSPSLVKGNIIGLGSDGVTALGNSEYGIVLPLDDRVIIGGTTAAERNVISANSSYNVFVGANSEGLKIQGNYIGTTADGMSPGGGTPIVGIYVGGTTGVVIGGPTDTPGTGAGNVISGNSITAGGGKGIILAAASGAVIQGNVIGLAADGTSLVGAQAVGLWIEGSRNNTIGGTDLRAANVISGNSNEGFDIGTAQSTGNTVAGNYIGTDRTGLLPRPNGIGVLLDGGANNNTIGGTTAGTRNIISGNSTFGVNITDAGTTGNTVVGNYIGTNAAGTAVPEWTVRGRPPGWDDE